MKKIYIMVASSSLAIFALISCSREVIVDPLSPESPPAFVTMTLESSAFGNGDDIPSVYTCDGENVSPPLRWLGAPLDAKAFALLVDDPDAPKGVFSHWILYNIDAEITELSSDIPPSAMLENGGIQTKNGFGTIGWAGPCPPSGQRHEYTFFIYALPAPIELAADASREDLAKAIREAPAIGVGRMFGYYERRR